MNIFQIFGSTIPVVVPHQIYKSIMLRHDGLLEAIPVTFYSKTEQPQLQVAHILGQFPVGGQIQEHLVK